MGLNTHLKLRIIPLFAGFFAGALLHMYLSHAGMLGGLAMPLFFVFPLAGAYLLQALFAHLVPARCPACQAARATPTLRNPILYACRACGRRSDALLEMLAAELARQTPERQARTEGIALRFFLVAGLAMAGIAVWLAADSIELVRHGVSTEARVMRVASQSGRDKDGNAETRYTAFVEYRVGKGTATLERGWSTPQGGHCMWPCYGQGQALRVVYLPDEPSRASIHSLPELFFAPALLGGVGSLFAAFGGVMLWRRRR